jgi:hypothetical protein
MLGSVLLAMVLAAGCNRATRVSDIVKDPGRFSGKDVSIQGRVSNSFSAFGNGFFAIDDSTGQIFVYSQNFGVPSNGTKVAVTGRIEQGISIAGRSYGIALRETEPYR